MRVLYLDAKIIDPSLKKIGSSKLNRKSATQVENPKGSERPGNVWPT